MTWGLDVVETKIDSSPKPEETSFQVKKGENNRPNLFNEGFEGERRRGREKGQVSVD